MLDAPLFSAVSRFFFRSRFVDIYIFPKVRLEVPLSFPSFFFWTPVCRRRKNCIGNNTTSSSKSKVLHSLLKLLPLVLAFHAERTPWMRLLLPLHLLVHKKKRRRRRRLKTKTGRKEYTRSHRPRSSFSSSFSSRFSLEKVLRRSVGGCRLQSSSTKTLRRQQKTRKLSSKTISFPNLPAERK